MTNHDVGDLHGGACRDMNDVEAAWRGVFLKDNDGLTGSRGRQAGLRALGSGGLVQ